ncbi:MAG: hypothetical protein HKL80_03400 [Acidimicrobiales bacterium]|nr:hypothetical protein [Acidimicrobiales bacterium]
MPVPRGGSLVAIVVTLFLIGSISQFRTWPLLVLPIAVLISSSVGLADDIKGLKPLLRLILLLTISLSISLASFIPSSFSPSFKIAAIIVGIIFIVGFINAWNFMDGIDGITAIGVAVTGLFWAIFASELHLQWLLLLSGALIGGALGFGAFNCFRSKTFAGDVGSYGWGSIIASTVVVAISKHVPLDAIIAPVVLSIADTSTTVIKRAWRKEKLFEAHKSHAYQRLHQRGYAHMSVSSIYGILSILCGVLGVGNLHATILDHVLNDFGIILIAIFYLYLPNFTDKLANIKIENKLT